MILEKLQQHFSELLQTLEEHGNLVMVVPEARSHELLQRLRDDPELKFDCLIDLCGVDRSGLGDSPCLEVVYHLYSLTHNHRLRVRVKVEADPAEVASVTDLWNSADWFERECWEMFGIRFRGHPNLKHLLLYDGFEGFPLRKDYPIAKRQKIPVPEEKLSA